MKHFIRSVPTYELHNTRITITLSLYKTVFEILRKAYVKTRQVGVTSRQTSPFPRMHEELQTWPTTTTPHGTHRQVTSS